MTTTRRISFVGVSNVLSEEKKQQVIALGRLGWSLRRIQRETGVRRETAARYLKSGGIAVREPGRWGTASPEAKPAKEVTPDSEAADSKPAKEVTPDFGVESAHPTHQPSASACEPWREWIEARVASAETPRRSGRNWSMTTASLPGIRASSDSSASCTGRVPRQACAIIETPPGEEAQVDYGDGPMVRDPNTGKYRRTRLFVLTLGYSRKSVRLLTFRSSSRIWAELHEQAFRRLGGSTRVVVLDNLREGVLKPDIYDPALNPLYRDLLAHYGAVALPCRVAHPDRKGKVEAGVGHAQKTPLQGLRFESLAEAQSYLDRWEERWADTRIHGTTKRQVAAMFAEEKPALQPLPLEPFRYYQYGERTVNLDGCVEVDAAYYSAPPGWIGRSVRVQWDERHVRLHRSPSPASFCASTCIRSAAATASRTRTVRRRRRFPRRRLLARCEAAGSNIGALCQTMHRQRRRRGHPPHSGHPLTGKEARRRARWMQPALPRSKPTPASTTSFAATSIASPRRLSRCGRSIPSSASSRLYRDLIADKTQENQS